MTHTYAYSRPQLSSLIMCSFLPGRALFPSQEKAEAKQELSSSTISSSPVNFHFCLPAVASQVLVLTLAPNITNNSFLFCVGL